MLTFQCNAGYQPLRKEHIWQSSNTVDHALWVLQFIKMTNPPNCCRWWSHTDNNILLREYHKHGVYLHKKKRQAVPAFAQEEEAGCTSLCRGPDRRVMQQCGLYSAGIHSD